MDTLKEHATKAQWILTRKIQRYPPDFLESDLIQTNNNVAFVNKNLLLFTLLPGNYGTNEDILNQMILQTRHAFSKHSKKARFRIRPFRSNKNPQGKFVYLTDTNYILLANDYLSTLLDVRQEISRLVGYYHSYQIMRYT